MLKEEEIELDLGLSIGGSFRKPEKSKLSVELPEKKRQSPPLSPPVSESAVPDPQAKREVQALRRQEEKWSRGRIDGLADEQPQPAAKKERAEANVNVNLNLSSNSGKSEPRCPYPYPPAQFVPYANGFAYPCVMPCNWTPAAGGGGFWPFKPHTDLGNI